MDNSKVTCICHIDLDGFAAASVVRRRYPGCQILYANYGRDLALWKIQAGSLIYVVDFSLMYEEFTKLKDQGFNIVWIDHHKNNYNSIESRGFTCPGIRDDAYCGAYLTWKYLFPNDVIPPAINLVNDYDLWKFEFEDTLSFSYGMNIFDTRPTSPSGAIWQELLNNKTSKLDQIITLGKPIQEYTSIRNKIISNDLAYKVKIHDKLVWFANTKQTNSMFFDSLDKFQTDGVMLGQWFSDVGKYRCSVYSPDDIKEVYDIAASFGGGGHPKASGFTYPNLPVERPQTKQLSTDEVTHLRDTIHKYESFEVLKHKNVIVEQCAAKSAGISLRANAFSSEFANVPCMAINHPYLPEIYSLIPFGYDVVNQLTGAIAKLAISFVLDNSNRYRVGLKSLDDTIDLSPNSPIMEHIKTISSNRVTNINGFYWFYTDEIPVELKQQVRIYY